MSLTARVQQANAVPPLKGIGGRSLRDRNSYDIDADCLPLCKGKQRNRPRMRNVELQLAPGLAGAQGWLVLVRVAGTNSFGSEAA